MANNIHLKSMTTYELHAWRDALSIAVFMDDNFDINAILKIFIDHRYSDDYKKFKRNNREIIAEFIQKPESRRFNYLKKVTADSDLENTLWLLVTVLEGLLLAKQTLVIRDSFREYLVPGKGNRITTAELYTFNQYINDCTISITDFTDVLDAVDVEYNQDLI